MTADFHTHILPGIDDGAGSVEEALEMLHAEAGQGVTHVIATPHFCANQDTSEAFLRKRSAAEARLREAMSDGLPQLIIGAEVSYFPGIGDCDALSELTFDGGRCVLIEMPMAPWTDRMYRDLEHIHLSQGLIPIVAHVDRYIAPFKACAVPEKLQDLPVVVQANAGFFLKGSTRAMALRMLRKGQIHVLGSDCHNMTDRPPNLGAALQRIRRQLGPDALEKMTHLGQKILGTRDNMKKQSPQKPGAGM